MRSLLDEFVVFLLVSALGKMSSEGRRNEELLRATVAGIYGDYSFGLFVIT
jgi:hypothetical protein